MEQQTKKRTCIGIVGLGLIGGSLGLELQALGHTVNALVNKPQTVERAKERGLAQVISTDPNILANCELVIIALPLDQLMNPPQEIINALPPNAVITDVGSVKAPVLKVWEKLHPRFIASHPMAGTTQSGIEAGHLGLFRESPWVATPNSKTDSEALELVQKLAMSLDTKWITTSAEKHDTAVALISHLPVLISGALLQTMATEPDPSVRELAKVLASSGFSDTTRVGGGNPNLGRAMAENNTTAVLGALTAYQGCLKKLEESILKDDWLKLQEDLDLCQKIRSSFICNKDQFN